MVNKHLKFCVFSGDETVRIVAPADKKIRIQVINSMNEYIKGKDATVSTEYSVAACEDHIVIHFLTDLGSDELEGHKNRIEHVLAQFAGVYS